MFRAQAAPVDWTLSLDDPIQSGAPGSTIVYSGMITNLTGSDIFLDTANISFTSPAPFTKDYEDAFLATLGDIPSTGYFGPIFFIQWLPGAAPGSSGTGSLDLTVLPPTLPSMLSVNFKATVSGVPEPTSFALLSLAVSILLGVRLFLRLSSQP